MPQFIFATRDTPKKVQTDGNPGLKPMALAMPCGWPGCVDCWAADPRAAAPTRRASCRCACNAVTCIACRCADEPASRATAQPHGGTRRRPAADETRALAPANGADRPGRGRQSPARTRQTPPHGRGPAPVAEPRGRVRVDHCICEPSVLALYPAAEPSAEPRPASAHGPRRRTHPRYDTRHKHLTRDLNVST